MRSRTRPVVLVSTLSLVTGSLLWHVVASGAAPVRSVPLGPLPRVASAAPADSTVGPWPDEGQAAYELDGTVHASPGQRPVPVASLAKVMTAYLVLQRMPATGTLTVTATDVADTARREARGDSVVDVAKGEVLTREEALEALLLPSANNVAVMLARSVSGSSDAFVGDMNTAAAALHLTGTHYTDPSGLDAGTVSTARDQLVLVQAALKDPTFARIVALPSAELPVAGTVLNTDSLLGQDGFVGVKTGSTQAAGGCFAFRVVRGSQTVTGVVLGQRDGPLIAAGLTAAQRLANAVLRS